MNQLKEPPNLALAAEVLRDLSTAAYILASMNLGNAVRILIDLGRPPAEIHRAVTETIELVSRMKG